MNKELDDVGDPFDRCIEECAELIKAISKAKRFGLFHKHGERPTNYDAIKFEMADVQRRVDKLDEHMSMLLRMRWLPQISEDTKFHIEGDNGDEAGSQTAAREG